MSLGRHAAAAAVAALAAVSWSAGVALAASPAATPAASPAATPATTPAAQPTLCVPGVCPTATATTAATAPPPTRAAATTPPPAASRPVATYRATRAPSYTKPAATTAPPVSGAWTGGPLPTEIVAATGSPGTVSATPVTDGNVGGGPPSVTRLLQMAFGAALVLGALGVGGLYLTRGGTGRHV